MNCGPRSYFNHIAITCLLSRTVYITRILLLFSTRYTHNLCFKQTDEIDNLIASWEQSICLCVCRFHKHLQSSPFFLSWSINLGFITEGKLAATLIIPSSWGSQLAGQAPRTRKSATHPHHCQHLAIDNSERRHAYGCLVCCPVSPQGIRQF